MYLTGHHKRWTQCLKGREASYCEDEVLVTE